MASTIFNEPTRNDGGKFLDLQNHHTSIVKLEYTMPENVTGNRVSEFIITLERLGASAGNQRLRQELGWDEQFYWRMQGHLVEQGRIVPGRGRGGSVRLTVAETYETKVEDIASQTTSNVSSKSEIPDIAIQRIRERDSYDALRRTIETTWIKRFGFDEVCVEETHSRGSKITGGTFTRPDITVAGIKRYVFLPKRLEIVTFEVKAGDCVDVMGVLEAIAHREAANRAYVLYIVHRLDFDKAIESERIMELSQKYGIGLILAENPENVESWEIILDAIRHEPDPARLDRFLGDLPTDIMRNHIQKWR